MMLSGDCVPHQFLCVPSVLSVSVGTYHFFDPQKKHIDMHAPGGDGVAIETMVGDITPSPVRPETFNHFCRNSVCIFYRVSREQYSASYTFDTTTYRRAEKTLWIMPNVDYDIRATSEKKLAKLMGEITVPVGSHWYPLSAFK